MLELNSGRSFILLLVNDYASMQLLRDEHTIFCPPGPLPFRKTSVNSFSSTGPGRGGIGLLDT